MDSAELVRVIERDERSLVESFFAELRTNLGTSHYHRLSNEELFRRGQAVFQHLVDWLISPDETAVQTAGRDLGRRRFAEGIPLGQVVLALILHEDRLWEFASLQDAPADESLRRQVAAFFSALIYGTAHGYERSLAQSSRESRRTLVAPSNAGAVAADPGGSTGGSLGDSKVLEVSRGGQVGEQGG